jgi:hypothetical protein
VAEVVGRGGSAGPGGRRAGPQAMGCAALMALQAVPEVVAAKERLRSVDGVDASPLSGVMDFPGARRMVQALKQQAHLGTGRTTCGTSALPRSSPQVCIFWCSSPWTSTRRRS